MIKYAAIVAMLIFITSCQSPGSSTPVSNGVGPPNRKKASVPRPAVEGAAEPKAGDVPTDHQSKARLKDFDLLKLRNVWDVAPNQYLREAARIAQTNPDVQLELLQLFKELTGLILLQKRGDAQESVLQKDGSVLRAFY